MDYDAPTTGDHATDKAIALAMIREASAELLNGLGASGNLTEEQKTLARQAAQRFIKDARRVEPNQAAYSQKPELAVLAALSAAWIKEAFSGETKSETEPSRDNQTR
jgi:hypothetical protein